MDNNMSEEELRQDVQRKALSSLPSFDDDFTVSLDRDKIAQAAFAAQNTTRLDALDLSQAQSKPAADADITAFLRVRDLDQAQAQSDVAEADVTTNLPGRDIANALSAEVTIAGSAVSRVVSSVTGAGDAPTSAVATDTSDAPISADVKATPDAPEPEEHVLTETEIALAALAEPVDESFVKRVPSIEPEEQAAEPEVIPLTTEPVAQGVFNYEPITQSEDDKGAKRKRRISRAKQVVAILLSLCCVAGLVYAAVGNYFTNHFMPRTTVNGEDVSGMSVEELSALVTSIGNSYKMHVGGDGLDLTISGPQIGFVYDGEAYGKDAQSQIDPWRWPLIIGQPHEFEVQKGISYDENLLKDVVSAAVNKINEAGDPPTNATMSYDGSSQSFVVLPDALGTQINLDAVLPIVSDVVATMQDEATIGEEQLIQPTITKDDETLNTTVSKLNGVLDNGVQLRVAGKDAASVDRDMLASWFILDDQLGMHVSHDDIQVWAQGALSEQFDTIGMGRSYTRPDGKQVQVDANLNEYSYGWCIDGAGLADILASNLSNYVSGAVDVPMRMSAATYNPGGQEWPNRYIDVDLSEQYVRMYDDSSNVIWESNCVSGNPIYGGGTATGVFTIFTKASPMELVGRDYDGDGEPDYRTPVDYWMAFDGGEGLHDATWRGSFGGSIYTYDGSHGCVNLPYSKAQELYGITNVGDVVIVHW